MTLKNLIQYQSTAIANYETISTVSDNITVLVEALTTTRCVVVFR